MRLARGPVRATRQVCSRVRSFDPACPVAWEDAAYEAAIARGCYRHSEVLELPAIPSTQPFLRNYHLYGNHHTAP